MTHYGPPKAGTRLGCACDLPGTGKVKGVGKVTARPKARDTP